MTNLREKELACRAALSRDPSNPDFRRNLAMALFHQGKAAEAAEQLGTYLLKHPLDTSAHYAYSRSGKYHRQDPVLQALEHLTTKASQLTYDDKIKLCYVIGKANQDIGEFEAAFSAFQNGGALHLQKHSFDESAHYAMLADVAAFFDQRYLARNLCSGVEASTPVFILGMPRSGSTLIEQILASHSQVSGAGELKYLKASVQQHLIGDLKTFSRAIPTWQAGHLRAAATDYLQQLEQHREPGTKHVVDKMPGNFVFVGLIKQLFPNARIIHSRRHPLATIWSNFSTLFGDDLHYSYDLNMLGRYYQRYQQMMDHWQQVLPADSVYPLDYETLITDIEGQSRKLLDFLELPWEADCLEFYRSKREVKTASLIQVRKPVYRSSLDIWRNYQSQLMKIESLREII